MLTLNTISISLLEVIFLDFQKVILNNAWLLTTNNIKKTANASPNR